MFITIEGGEGSGKSTLIKSLEKELTSQGNQVVVTYEPGGSKLGVHIREWLLNQKADTPIGRKAELLLFLADRVQHIQEVIKPALEQGKTVLCDRFNDSTVAYQGSGRSMGMDEVQELCDLVCDGLTPDLTFFLDIEPEAGLKRLKAAPDRLESEKIDFHNRVRQGFHALARQDSDRFHIIDATKLKEEVFSEALQIIRSTLHETEKKPKG
jgi:dTMP kinase